MKNILPQSASGDSNEVCKSYIEEIRLNSYRNFHELNIATKSKPVIIIGKNGVGKTNILEAISLLFPGKGLKSTKFDEICLKKDELIAPSWKIEAKIENFLGNFTISSSYNKNLDGSKRSVYFNGSKITNSELAKLNSVIWLTPQMDYIFLGPAADRRKFFDRIVYNFDPEHSSRINKYEYYVRERAQVLQTSNNKEWLNILEEKIAETAVAIAFARLQTLNFLQEAITSFESAFPKATLSLDGDIENIAAQYTALKLEDIIKEKLLENRNIDLQTKRTNYGPHRTNLVAFHSINNKPAHICSTGEQKAILISIILAEIYAKSKWTMSLPIVLLDEVTVHLDAIRKASLMEHLISTNVQFWVTANSLDQVSCTQDTYILELEDLYM